MGVVYGHDQPVEHSFGACGTIVPSFVRYIVRLIQVTQKAWSNFTENGRRGSARRRRCHSRVVAVSAVRLGHEGACGSSIQFATLLSFKRLPDAFVSCQLAHRPCATCKCSRPVTTCTPLAGTLTSRLNLSKWTVSGINSLGWSKWWCQAASNVHCDRQVAVRRCGRQPSDWSRAVFAGHCAAASSVECSTRSVLCLVRISRSTVGTILA